jgi:hypothetical protein
MEVSHLDEKRATRNKETLG